MFVCLHHTVTFNHVLRLFEKLETNDFFFYFHVNGTKMIMRNQTWCRANKIILILYSRVRAGVRVSGRRGGAGAVNRGVMNAILASIKTAGV